MSERQRGVVSDEMTALRGILARNGFGAAAANLRMGDLRNIDDLIRTWEQYPRSMEQYPLHLSRRLDKFQFRSDQGRRH